MLRHVTHDLVKVFETGCEDVGWINLAQDSDQLAHSCENNESYKR
jgi:hypothetical protein